MNRPIRHIALCLCLVALVSCETAVDPFVGGAHPYTLWGIVNAGSDTQFVRVFPVENRPGIDRSGGVDAAVTSTDLATGEERAWNRREVVYESGNVGQVFWSAFRPQHGRRYRIEVRRSDGVASTATVTVPPGIEISLDTRSENPRIPVRLSGGAPHLFGAEMVYEATNVPPSFVFPVGTPIPPPVFFPVAIPYEVVRSDNEEEWWITIDMGLDVGRLRAAYEANCLITKGNPDIALRRVEFRVIAADEAWIPPGGVFDPDVLVEPDAFSNVENGYGFIGAGEVIRIRWTPVVSLRDRLGFRTAAGCSMPSPSSLACTDPPIPCLGENAESIWEIYFGQRS